MHITLPRKGAPACPKDRDQASSALPFPSVADLAIKVRPEVRLEIPLPELG
jgi:hypothetical protein